MGKLKIEGKVTKEYKYDLMEVTIRFQVHGKSSSDVIRKVIFQCEDFLSVLSEQQISIDNIKIGDDLVDQEYDDGELDVCATREIVMLLPFDIGFSNYLMELICEKNYDVDYNVRHKLSRFSEIHNELLKLAIEDSKNKASFIAEAMNQRIVGIDSVDIGDRFSSHRADYLLCEQERHIMAPNRLSCSNKLKAPTTSESESVEVVWIIE